MSAPDDFKSMPTAPPPYSQFPQPPKPGDAMGYPAQAPPGYGPYAPATSYGFQAPVHGQAMPGYAPMPGQQDPNYPPPMPDYGATIITMPPQPAQVIVLNGCPTCRHGVMEDEYSCLGIFCAIFFFPIGVLFCLLMRERRCSNCRSVI